MTQAQSQPNALLTSLKSLAYRRAKRTTITLDELEDHLKMWWSDKYKLPDNHPLLLEKTLEELLVEYYTDVFRSSPEESKQFERQLGLSTDEPSDEEWFKKTMGNDYTPETAIDKKTDKPIGDFEDKY